MYVLESGGETVTVRERERDVCMDHLPIFFALSTFAADAVML